MTDNAYLGTAYAAKESSYYGGARHDYVDMLPVDHSTRILELGCGDGATGALALSEGKCGEYIGIEMFAPMAREAEKRLTRVHVGNVDEVDLPYPPGHFDVLIMSEVVEHLVDPETTLRRLVALVRRGGRIMASSPNIAHWRIIKELVAGRFTYTDAGAMDRTHLRWFTPQSYAALFEKVGVQVERVGPLGSLTGKQKLVAALLGGREHLFHYQINLLGRRAAS